MNPLRTTLNRQGIRVEKKQQQVKLSLIKNLLDSFHRQEIMYCHWKSNEHLAASMSGDTDLDILFGSREGLDDILNNLGFKKFQPVWQKQYRDIEDYIGLDFVSGKLVHLHAHFKLTLGEAYLKSYQLPYVEEIMRSRTFNQQHGIYCIKAEWELLLLWFREALKIRIRNYIGTYLLNNNAVSQNSQRECRWLQERSSESEIVKITEKIFPKNPYVYSIVGSTFDKRHLVSLSFHLKKGFSKFRMYAPLHALMARWHREVSLKINRKLHAWMQRPTLSRRTNPNGGFVVAVIGADGSGKSTVIGNLESSFKDKLDVFRVYFGRGDGKMSLPRKLLTGLKNISGKKKDLKLKDNQQDKLQNSKGFIANLYKCLEALIVSAEKRKNLNRMRAARKNGMLVICDRFPQNQVMGYNDGPLLHHLITSRNFIFRWAARREKKLYMLAARHTPDLVFKLMADASVVAARKPGETPLPLLEAKIEGIRATSFNGSRICTIDATQPLEKVLHLVKKELWLSLP